MTHYKTYSTYDEALRESTQDAYQNKELVDVIYLKTCACIESMQSGQYAIDATSAFSAIGLLQYLGVKKLSLL